MHASTLDEELLWHRLLDGQLHVAASGWRGDTRTLTLSAKRAPTPLTPTEKAVLTLVLLGASNKCVALELGVTPSTVSCHLREARRKLNATEAELLLFGRLVLASLAERGVAGGPLLQLHVATRLTALTGSQRHIVRMLCEGASNKEIANRRGTSVRTVTSQLARLYQTLDVGSRRELVLWAFGVSRATPSRSLALKLMRRPSWHS